MRVFTVGQGEEVGEFGGGPRQGDSIRRPEAGLGERGEEGYGDVCGVYIRCYVGQVWKLESKLTPFVRVCVVS